MKKRNNNCISVRIVNVGINIMNCENIYPKETWNENETNERYDKSNPDSFIKQFGDDLTNRGLKFESNSQVLDLVKKHKKDLVPIVINYYEKAKLRKVTNEQHFFLQCLSLRGLRDVAPMLIRDFYDEQTDSLTRWYISDCLFSIRAEEYLSDYMKIVLNKSFGINRQMIVLLLGKIKDSEAIHVLISLLEDDDVQLHALIALGEYKNIELRPVFNRFLKSKKTEIRNVAKRALAKIDKIRE